MFSLRRGKSGLRGHPGYRSESVLQHFVWKKWNGKFYSTISNSKHIVCVFFSSLFCILYIVVCLFNIECTFWVYMYKKAVFYRLKICYIFCCCCCSIFFELTTIMNFFLGKLCAKRLWWVTFRLGLPGKLYNVFMCMFIYVCFILSLRCKITTNREAKKKELECETGENQVVDRLFKVDIRQGWGSENFSDLVSFGKHLFWWNIMEKCKVFKETHIYCIAR